MTVYRSSAPWSRALRWISATVVLLVVGLSGTLLTLPDSRAAWVVPILWLGLGVAALFRVGGYEVTDGWLHIRRPGWSTRIPLLGLESAASVPNAMQGSLRTFGNGGLFAFTGWYWSRSLGSHRAWVNDLQRTVVLKVNGATLVVSPDAPDPFVDAVRAAGRPAASA